MADNLVYQSEKTLRDMGDQVDSALKAEVENKAVDVKKALEGDDKEKIVYAGEALQQALSQLGQAAYQQAGPQAEAAAPGSNGASAQTEEPTGQDENVVEGEFTEA